MSKTDFSISNLGLVNLDTGEVLDRQAKITYSPDLSGQRFTKLTAKYFDAKNSLVAKGGSYKTAAFVADVLIKSMNNNNLITKSCRVIADEMGMARQTISKAIKTLLYEDFIRHVEKQERGVSGIFMLNPDFGSKISKDKMDSLFAMWNNLQKENEPKSAILERDIANAVKQRDMWQRTINKLQVLYEAAKADEAKKEASTISPADATTDLKAGTLINPEHLKDNTDASNTQEPIIEESLHHETVSNQ